MSSYKYSNLKKLGGVDHSWRTLYLSKSACTPCSSMKKQTYLSEVCLVDFYILVWSLWQQEYQMLYQYELSVHPRYCYIVYTKLSRQTSQKHHWSGCRHDLWARALMRPIGKTWHLQSSNCLENLFTASQVSMQMLISTSHALKLISKIADSCRWYSTLILFRSC